MIAQLLISPPTKEKNILLLGNLWHIILSFSLLVCLLQREEQGNEKDGGGGQRRVRNRVRGKGRGRSQYHHNHNNNHGNHVGTPPSSSSSAIEQAGTVKQQPPGPRMPDGTRGFAMGRGKPMTVNMT